MPAPLDLLDGFLAIRLLAHIPYGNAGDHDRDGGEDERCDGHDIIVSCGSDGVERPAIRPTIGTPRAVRIMCRRGSMTGLI